MVGKVAPIKRTNNKPKKEKKWGRKERIAYAKTVLRNATKRTKGYNEAINRTKYIKYDIKKDGTPSKRYQNYWKCEFCGEEDLKKKEINVDHQIPVAFAEDFEDWVVRLFCEAPDLNIICLNCHSEKTKQDRKDIAEWKRERKANESS